MFHFVSGPLLDGHHAADASRRCADPAGDRADRGGDRPHERRHLRGLDEPGWTGHAPLATSASRRCWPRNAPAEHLPDPKERRGRRLPRMARML